ncbi:MULTISPECIES: hypothetical protein [Chryseobacterium]|uniref:Uncharacterized protein n=1 Tax=Chryseobacterium balustinum TaxID=246 RepID=A0AAX2IHI4_9FLAO|nr:MULTISPECIES: hypothetical protein [Chryseobacterium]AZB31174.1 hypothetical protein EB354_18980 [Chryseobacterium balustinum]MBM7417957.1 hypothetical protein [Chryseobacterium sp. JUb44]MDH6212156.1 hypothetical protein [Chryseobacterium sp. BIGb0186]WSO10775.1 hypothetical protein VUJ64_02385 [Chryseobacterium scophthalmum]SKB39205.1 hypothetical protein SAMN05421800_101364 [Chryseobacterium balustinum]
MEQKLILDAIHGAVWRKKIREIFTLKDMYKDMTGDSDLSNLKIDIVLKNKEIFEWIIQHPEYDYKELLESPYSNEELFRFFKIYYESIIFKLNKYFSGDYTIRLSEIENM